VKRALRAEQTWKEELRAETSAGGRDAVDTVQLASRELRHAVQDLRDQDQQVIYLRFFLSLSVEETGMALGLPAGTVKSRLSRALERLRQDIQVHHPALRQALEE
jgi:RNA polymerase sigma-70 factor (ECF subfamily)